MTTTEKSPFPPWLEWEFLREECKILNPTIDKKLPGTPVEIKIWRDDEYKLKAEISGKTTEFPPTSQPEQSDAGAILPSFTISGKTNGDSSTFEIGGCLIGDHSTHYEPINAGFPQGTFHAELRLQRIKIIQQKDVPVEWLTEWYINGIKADFILFRSTVRTNKEIFSRERKKTKEKPETFDTGESFSGSIDHALIKCEDFSFIIHTVPEQFGPAWSNNIGIEYRSEFGRIPSPEERSAISEIVSFIIGKHLLKIGYTSYDKSGIPIEKVAVNPWGDNIRHLAQTPPIPPIQIGTEATRGKIETILPPLVKKYLELKEPLQLNEVLWRYWIGSELPLGSNIPIMANGIEILIKYWFKSQKSKSKGIYLKKDEFDTITQEEFKKIEITLANKPFKEKIMNKLKDCYKMSLTDQLKFFFEEIGLPLGKTEEDAIRCRHKMIHSSVNMGATEIQEIIRLSFAYRCLVHRTVLKILDYTGTYVDYSMIGFPEKQIDIVVGGPTSGLELSEKISSSIYRKN
jgi:hypothetical protein